MFDRRIRRPKFDCGRFLVRSLRLEGAKDKIMLRLFFL
jgi:hypothetical protein